MVVAVEVEREVEVEAEVEGEEEEEVVEVGNAAGVEEAVRLTAADLKAT